MKLIVKALINVAILCVVLGTLIISDFFYYPSQTSFFFYLSSVTILFLSVALSFWQKKHVGGLKITLSGIVLFCWLAYIILQQYATAGFGFNGYYAFTNLIYFVSLSVLLNSKKVSLDFILTGVMALGFLETLLCLLQWTDIIKSSSKYFKITGSWDNPNITAMFLVMTIPTAFYLWRQRKYRRYISVVLSFILLSLLLLKCRTALVGLAVIVGSAVQIKYRVLHYLKTNKQIGLGILLFVLILGFAIPVFTKIYQAKQASADGRVLVYRLSLGMIKENHFFGIGYGQFERGYNIYQAAFLKARPETAESNIAGHVKMAYNDYLQNMVEGGLIGFCLFTGCTLFLLTAPRPRPDFEERKAIFDAFGSSKLGLAAFASMAMVNFAIEAIPVMCLFILYAALISYQAKSFYNFKALAINQPFQIAGFIVALLIGYINLSFVYANQQNAVAKKLIQSNRLKEAIALLESLKKPLKNLESYHRNFAVALYRNHNYQNALDELSLAKNFTSDPQIFRLAGLCSTRINQFALACKEFEKESEITPTVFAPRYYLMNAALKAGNTPLAVNTAQGIIDLSPKIKSSKVFFYKSQASALLSSLGVKQPKNLTNKNFYNPEKKLQTAEFPRVSNRTQSKLK